MKRILKYNILLLIILLINSGCSTKKNTGLTRFYHGLTTKYNVLFNGTESFKDGVKKYKESYVDDYSQVLPIFIYGDEEIAAGIKSQMDRTIEKSTKSISLHSITTKPDKSKLSNSAKDKAFYSKNEFNVYIDESYLVMGKAFFYQGDYASAIRIFNYIISQYDDENTKYLAQNWLVRSDVEIKDYKEAQEIIGLLLKDIDYPEKLNYELNLTISDFYLKQQKYSEAEQYILASLELVKKRSEKTRLKFILAQINEELNKPAEASALYDEVIKLNPSYEMSFNAKIKRASLFTGGRSAKTIKEELLDMLKDDKNTEYQDQIYYALAGLEMKNNNKTQAIEYYKLSAKTSVANENQKALTFLALANIYFGQAEYVQSQAYFDSTVNSLDPDFPGYIELSKKNQFLGKLVRNLNEIKLQDSVQVIAKMSEAQRTAFIQKLIRDLQEKEANDVRREREAEMNDRGDYGTNSRPTTSSSESGKWYFYNPSAKSFGEPEFKRRWGSRKLEDNWRRKNKKIQGIEQITESEFSDDILDNKKGLDKKTPEYYMVDLPLTDSAMDVSHKKIQAALYKVGETYRNDLKDYPKAIDAYKDLIERYPESKYKVPAYYSMYKAYSEQGNTSQADMYKNMIIRNYPQSTYAKVLVDPNYFKQFEKEEIERKNHYLQTLNVYKSGNYSEVINRSNAALNNIPDDSDYTPKYRYLKALAMGKIYGSSTLKTELEKITVEFRKDPVANLSEELLASLQKNELNNLANNNVNRNPDNTGQNEISNEQIIQKSIEEIERIYSYRPEAIHYVAVAIAKSADINQLKFNIINFNLDFYIEKSYDIENQPLNDFLTILTIKQFNNSEESLEYYSKFNEERERVFNEVKSANYQYFVISEENLTNLTKEKLVQDYLLFFKKYYKK